MPSATKIVELQSKITSLERRGWPGMSWESSAKLKKELEDLVELRRVMENKVRTTMLRVDSMGGNIMPVKLRLQNPLEHDFGGHDYRDISYETLLKQAKDKGHDGALFRNTRDGGGVTDIYVVFDSSQIRSRFAAFDPERSDTGNITASFAPLVLPLGAGTAAAAYLANQEQE